MELSELIDFCLERVFKFCDSETIVSVSQTCVRFNTIATNLFKNCKTYDCYIDALEKEEIAINVMRKVGKHLIRLYLNFGMNYSPANYNSLFDILNSSLSCENFRELSLSGQLCNMPIEQLSNVFAQLETLNLGNQCQQCVYYVDLFALCPNLKDLTVTGKLIFAPNHRKSFEQLEKLDIFRPLTGFYSKNVFQSFIQQNQQLKTLRVGGNGLHAEIQADVNISHLGENLKNLEHLSISTTRIQDMSPQKIIELHTFEKLQSLTLCNINTQGDLNAILDNVTSLKSLKGLSMNGGRGVFFLFTSITNIASELQQLQVFEFTFFCEPEIIIDFVRHARSLRKLSFCGGFEYTPGFVREIAKARKDIAVTAEQLSCCMGNRDEWDDLIQIFKEADVQRYLKFDSLIDESTMEELLSD